MMNYFTVKTLLDSLIIDSAYVFGKSDGGILGLIIENKYPMKNKKLAVFDANLYPECKKKKVK